MRYENNNSQAYCRKQIKKLLCFFHDDHFQTTEELYDYIFPFLEPIRKNIDKYRKLKNKEHEDVKKTVKTKAG